MHTSKFNKKILLLLYFIILSSNTFASEYIKKLKDQIKFLSKNGASSLTHYFDKKMNIFKAINLRGVPTTILVDKTGLVVSKHEGILKWSEDVIVKEIVHLLN